MTTVIVDKELTDKLKAIEHKAVLCDESGSTVGWFLPEAEYMKKMYERARQMFTDEELERARRQPGGFTTAEVLEHLNKLP
jgi:hypothetical protein